MTKMSDDLGIFPFQAGGEDRLFLARFEFPKFGEDFQIPKGDWRSLKLLPGEEAPPATEDDTPAGFIHFLTGFPIDTIEMLILIGEFSSKAQEGEDSKVVAQDGGGKCFSPVWDGGSKIFVWPDEDRILLNTTALLQGEAFLFFAENLPGEPEPAKAHWWFRVELQTGTEEEPLKFPVPGEFLGLGVRMMPGEYWGHQLSSPFIYSGNWADTVYLTGGRIKSVIEPTDTVAYPTYEVQWRKNVVTVRPSDFATYEVDDRVTILKDVAPEKQSQLWTDDDMDPDCDKETWQIVPFSFYGLEKPAE